MVFNRIFLYSLYNLGYSYNKVFKIHTYYVNGTTGQEEYSLLIIYSQCNKEDQHKLFVQ